MTLLRINMQEQGLAMHGSALPVADTIRDTARGTGPVILMIHGYKFEPGHPDHCPHAHIFSLRSDHDCWKARSWPRELGLDGSAPGRLGVAFGWPARGSIWQAYAQAAEAGRALADLIRLIRRAAPHRPVHAMAHSLGARVVLSALPHLPPHALSRAILLAGAEFSGAAEAALDTPAGRTIEVLSITSRENSLYDRLLERVIAAPHRGDAALGRRSPRRGNWLTLPLDDAATLSALRRLGHDIAPPQRRVCHWSTYLRPGVFPFYTALLTEPKRLPLPVLRRSLDAEEQAPAGWRFRLPAFSLPLPMGNAAP